MNTFYTVCVLAFLAVAHGFSMSMNASERTYIMVSKKEFFFQLSTCAEDKANFANACDFLI